MTGELLKLESESKDLKVRVLTGGVIIEILGHRWSIGFHPDRGLTVLPTGLSVYEGHKPVSHPRECPGCAELVVSGDSPETTLSESEGSSESEPRVLPKRTQ